MSLEENKAFCRRWIEAMDEGNTAIIDESFANNGVLHLPGGLDVTGPEALKAHLAKGNSDFPEFQHVIEDMIAEGDKVAARFINHGIYNGEYAGKDTIGKKVSFTSTAIYRICEGKLLELWVDYDALGMLQQLGMELRPKAE